MHFEFCQNKYYIRVQFYINVELSYFQDALQFREIIAK